MTSSPERERLELEWADQPGVPGFLRTVDHKRIGHRYIATALVFFALGGLQALTMRWQLATPGGGVVSAETYNRLFTLHGTTMIFLFNTPVLAGFGNYLLPLMIGARDVAFPRLNALSYWIYLGAGLLLYASVAAGEVPDAGWFAYVPLSSDYSAGMGLDFWAVGVVFVGVSTTMGAVNFIVTTFKLRAPGMAASRMPVLVWAFLVTSFIILFSLPAITLGPFLLELDRAVGTSFFDPALGGDPVLYQHLFWFWGHPEVYILFLPATGMISMIVPTFARRPLVGYRWIVASLVAVGFVSFGVWVHHMFAVGIPDLTASFFSLAGLGIAFPSAVQVFVWLATLRSGRPQWRAPLLWSAGFIAIFVLGGITGVMVSVVPFDWQATDSYFVVAHLHYVLIGGVVFPIVAGLHYWWPKATGWLLHERLGRISFWVAFVGFHLTFFPQHIVGLMGMPRRVASYDPALGWASWNLVSSAGAAVLATGFLLVLVNLVHSARRRLPAGANPWDAGTLEWATLSPPSHFNFLHDPEVGGRDPLWTGDLDWEERPLEEHGKHLVEQTRGLRAASDEILDMPAPSIWPLVVAAAGTLVCVGVLLRLWPVILLGGAALAVALAGWFLPLLSGRREGAGG